MANQSSTTLKLWTIKVTAEIMKTLPRLSLTAIALLLFVGASHAQAGPCPPGQFPCVLVSDGGQVSVWSDDGTSELNFALLCEDSSCPGGGGGSAGEGMACLSGSSNVLYTANNSSTIDVWNMNLVSNKADLLKGVSVGGGSLLTGLGVNGIGTLLYASGGGDIFSLSPLSASPWLMVNSYQTTADTTHDLGVGTCAAGTSCTYGGNIFTTHFQHTDLGMNEFAFNPNLNQMLPNLGEILPPSPNNCASFSGVSGNPHCWHNLSGVVFDNDGNLWVNSTGATDQGTFEFSTGGTCGSPFCPLNFVPIVTAGRPFGVAVAPATDPINPGKILIANYDGGRIEILDPSTCTGQHPSGSPWTPGTCHERDFISSGLSSPKYVIYNQNCTNPDDDGYVEICKDSDPSHPVSGTFNFTITAPQYSSGTIAVPVGYCSGSIKVPSAVPSGSVTITETPTIGDLVSNVLAYSYDNLGQYVNELESWTEPNLYATVGVMPGDVSLETEAIFTNYAAQNGQLKICKIAGQPQIVNSPFTFIVTGPGGYRRMYTIPAGPPDQGGYCQLADTFPANTPLTIMEFFPGFNFYQTSISVDCNACSYSFPNSLTVATTIGAGVTEVDFTNSFQFSIH